MFTTITITIEDVITFILDEADDEAIDRVYAATKTRNEVLRAKIAARASVGAAVTIRGIKPKYFDGLTGTITKIDGKYATVRFDKRSTDVLRYKGRRRYYIPATTTEYEVGGLPLTTCSVV